MNISKLCLGVFIVSLLLISAVSALEEDANYPVGGLELEKLIALVNGCISTFLFIFAFIAYKRSERKRFIFVALAFFLFAVKSFLVSSELFFVEIEWFDPLSTILEFLVLLSFFYGVLKR